jgi:beta-glucosidase
VLATDDLMKALSEGRITRGQLARCVKNLLRYVLRTPALVREARGENIRLLGLAEKADSLTTIVEKDEVKSDEVFFLERDHKGVVLLSITYSCDGPKLAQIPVSFMVGNSTALTLLVTNTDGESVTVSRETNLPPNPHCKLVFSDTVKVERFEIKE